jgi:signal peptidase I
MTTALRTARITGLVLLAAVGWLFWPTSAGGATTYVVTHGTSMQPRFSTGDLAVLRSAGSYDIGDVVAYSSATLGTTVMHRIVARDGDAFVTEGDHNSWQDPDHPTAAQIQGRLWLRVPQGGAALQQLRQPWTLALLGLAGPALLWGVRPRTGRHRRGRRRAPRPASTPRTAATARTALLGLRALRPAALPTATLPALPPAARATARQAALGCAAVALLAGAGEAVLLGLPATQTDTRTVVVAQQAHWGWSGTATPGATYPTGQITTGDPVWTRLAGPVTVSLRDTVGAPGVTALRGTVRLVLGVQAGDGWHADVTSGPAAAPVAGTTTASVVLDPVAAADLLHRHLAEIGANGDGATLTVTPQVALTGTVGGRPFTAPALPAFSFTMDGTVLRPASGAAALAPTAPATVPAEVVVPRRLALGPVAVPLDLAGIAVGVLAVVAVAAAAACAFAGRPGPAGAADDAALRASGRLLPVRRFTPGSQVVDVEDGAALLRLAERLDLLVLHAAGEDADVYAVQDGETSYRWTAAPATATANATALTPDAEAPEPPVEGRAPLRVLTTVG